MMTAENSSPADILQNLRAVKTRIDEAAHAADRDPETVALVAISKTHGADRIADAITAGQRLFGENRVQESEAKWPALLEGAPDVRLHLVGPLQSNKVKRAVQLYHGIQTLDRLKLARALAREFDAQGRQVECFIQINIGEEPQKAGIRPREADGFIAECRDTMDLPIVGLMCIPPADEEAGLHFGLLAEIAARSGLDRISMGMSGDFETAVRFGATHVRVGTAIFGQRPQLRPAPE